MKVNTVKCKFVKKLGTFAYLKKIVDFFNLIILLEYKQEKHVIINIFNLIEKNINDSYGDLLSLLYHIDIKFAQHMLNKKNAVSTIKNLVCYSRYGIKFGNNKYRYFFLNNINFTLK